MERGLKSAEVYRATALHCRQLAADDPDNRWRLLSEAERWEYLAEQMQASRQKNRPVENPKSAIPTGMTSIRPTQPDTIATPRPAVPPPKPSRLG